MSSDRAAVAREVLTELANWNMARVETLKDAMRFRDERYPAPAAPVTVTVVDGDGVQMKWKKGEGGYWVTDSGHVLSPASWAHSFAERVASDARRIEALERERGAARRALEAAQSAGNAPSSHQTPMTAALGRLAATGASAVPPRCGNPTGATVAQECRDMATATSQGEGLGKITEAEQVAAEEPGDSRVTVEAAPAPIPLGATVEVEGTRWVLGTGDDEEEWCTDDGTTTRTHDHDAALAALYHARHPVADAATVERVARAILDNDREQLGPSDWEWNVVGESVRGSYLSNARAALRALGYTIQEGA